MIIVSACLAGVACRHDGTGRENELIQELAANRLAMPMCPEVLGGREIPRTPCEIQGGTGADVIAGRAKVTDKNGKDVTKEIMEGVNTVLKAVERMNVTAVILKSKSPTCGCGSIYDGSFSGKLIAGDGVLAAALKQKGVKVYTEENCGEFAEKMLKVTG